MRNLGQVFLGDGGQQVGGRRGDCETGSRANRQTGDGEAGRRVTGNQGADRRGDRRRANRQTGDGGG